MKFLLLCGLAGLCAPSFAASLACSTHARADADTARLQAQAKVTLVQARATALAAVGARAAQVVEGELEVERGCVLYSFDIRVPHRAGIEEVMVDPASGAVLAHTHENSKQMAAERVSDAAELKARAPKARL